MLLLEPERPCETCLRIWLSAGQRIQLRYPGDPGKSEQELEEAERHLKEVHRCSRLSIPTLDSVDVCGILGGANYLGRSHAGRFSQWVEEELDLRCEVYFRILHIERDLNRVATRDPSFKASLKRTSVAIEPDYVVLKNGANVTRLSFGDVKKLSLVFQHDARLLWYWARARAFSECQVKELGE